MERGNKNKLLAALELLAYVASDGHFTIMKFTTNWRVCLGTPADREDISMMAEGKTLDEAISALLRPITERDGMNFHDKDEND